MTSSSRSRTSRRARKARGAIAIDVARVEESPEWAPVCVLRTGRPRFVAGRPGYYVADGQIQQVGIEWPIPEAVRMVQQYDPEREVVFAFLREDGRISSYRIRVPGALTPLDITRDYK